MQQVKTSFDFPEKRLEGEERRLIEMLRGGHGGSVKGAMVDDVIESLCSEGSRIKSGKEAIDELLDSRFKEIEKMFT